MTQTVTRSLVLRVSTDHRNIHPTRVDAVVSVEDARKVNAFRTATTGFAPVVTDLVTGAAFRVDSDDMGNWATPVG